MNAILRLFDKKLLRFILVGLFNTLMGAVTMFGFYNLLRMGYWGSSALSYFLCSVISFFLNRNYTFGDKGGYGPAALKFAANIVICYALAYLAAKPLTLYILEALAKDLPAIAPALAEQFAMLVGMVFFTGLNYLGQRFFVFPDKREGREQA